MKKFKILKAGTSASGTNWSMIVDEIDGILLRAFVRTTKAQKEGEELAIPAALVSKIDWQL